MSTIGARSFSKTDVGVATEDGKAYYLITSLLKAIKVQYVDVMMTHIPGLKDPANPPFLGDYSLENLKLIITTRKERLRFLESNVVCVEDLGHDPGVAKERLFSILYPTKDTDYLVVGIDPGKRTGMAVFMNQMEIESAVLGSVEDTVARVEQLIDNAPRIRKMVKIGSGMPRLAQKIASMLDARYGTRDLRIQLVDEHGTSSLNSLTKKTLGTRDQRAAKLIAFREGRDYFGSPSFSRFQ